MGLFNHPVFIGLIIIALMVLIARKAQPAGDASGDHFVGSFPVSSVGDTLRVATFNIQTGKSNTGERDIMRSARRIAHADLVGVQEVYAKSLLNRLGIGTEQSHALAASGNFNYVFNPTRRRWFSDHRGNAVFTRLPVTRWKTHMLPDQSGKSFRNMTVVRLTWNGQPLVFINTHLHTSTGRDEQLKQVLAEFARHPRAILVGDFNATPTDPQLITLLQQNSVTDAIGVLQLDPKNDERIDWILTKGFKVVGGNTSPKGISDHPYYEVSLTDWVASE